MAHTKLNRTFCTLLFVFGCSLVAAAPESSTLTGHDSHAHMHGQHNAQTHGDHSAHMSDDHSTEMNEGHSSITESFGNENHTMRTNIEAVTKEHQHDHHQGISSEHAGMAHPVQDLTTEESLAKLHDHSVPQPSTTDHHSGYRPSPHDHHSGHKMESEKDIDMMMDQAVQTGNKVPVKDEKKYQDYIEMKPDYHEHHPGGHGDHEDDMKNGSMPHMKMFFHGGVDATVLFEGWKIATVAGMIGSVIGIILLATFYEGLKYFREFLFKQYVSSMQFSTVAVTGESGKVTQVHKVQRHRMLSFAHLTQTCLHVIQMIISYFLMLIFMTYNIWLCLAVIIGAGIGYFVFGWKKATVVDITEHCH